MGSVTACSGKNPCEELFDTLRSCYQTVNCGSIPNVGDLEGSFCRVFQAPQATFQTVCGAMGMCQCDAADSAKAEESLGCPLDPATCRSTCGGPRPITTPIGT